MWAIAFVAERRTVLVARHTARRGVGWFIVPTLLST
jgi:hypothetical protein